MKFGPSWSAPVHSGSRDIEKLQTWDCHHPIPYIPLSTGELCGVEMYSGISRYSRSKVALSQIGMAAWPGPIILHRYYSSSLSPYGACSTNHYSNHCASAQRNCFWNLNLRLHTCLKWWKSDFSEICPHNTNVCEITALHQMKWLVEQALYSLNSENNTGERC